MNGKQTPSQLEAKQNNRSRAPFQRIQQLVNTNLLGTIRVAIVGSLLLTGVSTWNIWNIYNSFQSTITKQFELGQLGKDLVYQDEFLTMSARMAASSGDVSWEERYNKMVPQTEATLKQLFANLSAELRVEASKTDVANSKLVALENQSFQLVRQGKGREASQILMGAEYSNQKKIYSDGNSRVLAKVERSIQQQLQNYQQQLLIAIGFAVAALPISIGCWLLVLSAVRNYIRDRQAALIEIERSRTSLMTLNESLAQESQLRQQQEHSVRQERDLLQSDIGELLDVVCEIEAGDFTVQANVNERATGLVGDTLNRLVETLGVTIDRVATDARQVAIDSHRQTELAAEIARNTSAQASSVDRVLALTATVRTSADTAAAQLADTNRSVALLQSAVTAGEIAISTLDREIDVLQQGSDRIVQQMKALGEFVGLADKFVYDQTEIATQTQVLALNASLVAARAAEQRDPKEFEVVAREFESIASQVSQLAQQTNEGLTNLEQRNTQIERVVADVDGEVQRLGSLVDSFTHGVKQSREVFLTVRAVTTAVVEAGEVVSQTSRTIISSAESTARSISSIATLSAQIDSQSQIASTISTQMSVLSTKLLTNIQVFKLPTLAQHGLSTSATPILATELPNPTPAPAQNYQFN